VWGPRERGADDKVYQHRPYAKYDTDGRKIYATMTEGNEAAYRNSVYYAEVRPAAGYTPPGDGGSPALVTHPR